MKLGIIGAGGIAQAIAKQALRAGYEVVLSNSRGPDSLKAVVHSLGKGANAGTKQEAASQEVVFVSVPWPKLKDALKDLPSWNGRIVVDTNNPISAPDFKLANLGGRTSSEVVQELVPGANLVKAMNTLPPETLESDASQESGQRVLFISGEDVRSKQKVAGIFERMGFAPIDLGGLAGGGSLYQFPGGPLAAQNLMRLPLR
ncbi:MAG: NAD(P)-binding domain-containing protein [Bdellovibrionaceae bacterium]|nr:NAD(P)-binding domain-containing protein [Pseudobdellovibrionaceae bacterium]